jgi:integrase
VANIYWRNGIAWGRITRDGTEHRESLKTASSKVARKRFTAWIAKLEGKSFGERPAHSFDEAVLRFTKEHLPTIKRNSSKRYNISIDNLAKSFEGMALSQIRSAALIEFVSTRRAEGVTASTIRRDLACLSSIFGMATEWEWEDVNPVGPFLKRMKRRGLREAPSRTRYLSHDEETALLKHAADYVANAMRFAIDTGLRKEEQFSREWSHVDLARSEVQVFGSTSKNAKDRKVPLLARARSVLEALPRHIKSRAVFWHIDKVGKRRGTARRFNTMDRGLKAAARRAGVTDLRWHDLRRTCGCRLLQDRKLSMDEVSKWLGHSSVAVTEKAYAFLFVDQLHEAVGTTKQETN